MSQIRDKKGRKKGIETKNPINAKSVQLIELHAFACDLVCIYLSESFDFLKCNIHWISVIYNYMVQIRIVLMSVHWMDKHWEQKKNLQLAQRKIYIYLTIYASPDFI